jgi:dihydroflavonol-4-reductase
MRIAVTGATGHVGANLIRALIDHGHEVRALVLKDRLGLDGLPVSAVSGDVLDPGSLERAFEGIERVFHLAARISIAPGDEREVHAVNVVGTRNVAAACLSQKVRRLVHFSSIHALSAEPSDRIIDETRALAADRGLLPYDRSKADGEREVQAAIARGLDAVIVTPTAILGPNDFRPSLMGTVLLQLHARKMPALVDGGFDWVDVRDVVAGALRAADRAEVGARYLLSGTRRTVAELAALVEATTGIRAPRLVAPMWLARASAPFATAFARATGTPPLLTRASLHALRSHQRVSHDKASRDLGYVSRPLDETLQATFDWFRTAGMIGGRT